MTKKSRRGKQKILHIGCGINKIPGATGVDINKKSHADVIHNLNVFPYPFQSNQFDKIIAEHIIEHLEDIPHVMEEIYRISKNKARVIINSAHFSSLDSFTDPTHKHFLTSRTFDYFIPGTPLYNYQYSEVKFKKLRIILGQTSTRNYLYKVLLYLINKYSIFYEKR